MTDKPSLLLNSALVYGGPAAEMRQCHLNNIHFYYYYLVQVKIDKNHIEIVV